MSRSLAKALIKEGRNLLFVRWDEKEKSLRVASQEEVKILEKWNGPKISQWAGLDRYASKVDGKKPLHLLPLKKEVEGGWLLVPEVTHITNLSYAPTDELINYAKRISIKTAFIFYDAIPLKLEEYGEVREKHTKYMQDIALADLILPISRFAGEDLKKYYCEHLFFDGKTLPAIAPIPLAGELSNARASNYVEPDEKSRILLSVGTIEPRKNQTTLLDVFNQLCRKNPSLKTDLVLVGNLHPSIAPSLSKAMELNPRIKYLKYVQDEELYELYKRALFTIFPSVEEGFGLPIIESLWHGKPSICANFGAMEEIAKEGGCMAVDVKKKNELVDAMEEMLQSAELRLKLGREATTRKIKTWKEYAMEIVEAFKQQDDPIRKLSKIYYLTDHTCTYPRNTGIQRVTRMLGRALEQLGAPVQMVKWNHEKDELMNLDEGEKKHLARWNGPKSLLPGGLLSDELADGWLLIPELTTYAGGGFLKKVIGFAMKHKMHVAAVFYDTIPYKLKEMYPPEATSAHKEYMEAIADADHVFCISEASKGDLLDYCYRLGTHFNCLPDRIHACPLATEFLERPRILSNGKKHSDTIKILSVGTLEPRKNHKTLIEAFNKLCGEHEKKHFELIVAGGCPFPDLVKMMEEALRRNKSIKWVREADDVMLSKLYEECDFTVYPSIEEGFGLPIVESIWHAKPCISHKEGALGEAACGGGCVTIDMHNVEELKSAMEKLALHEKQRLSLTEKAMKRPMKTWEEYGREIMQYITQDQEKNMKSSERPESSDYDTQFYRPLLSICITTYNRAQWLGVSLSQVMKLTEPYRDIIEVVVCDNASTDDTAGVVARYKGVENFRYFCNPSNVGMLGNLHVTARHSSGQYVWLVGDDDLIKEGTIEHVIKAILNYPRLSLIYLNYGYTTQDSTASCTGDLDLFISQGIPIVPPSPDFYGKVKEIAPNNENFFTAIYACVFRRDHALFAYSQDITGRPFSSLLTCVPTTYHICNNMFDEPGYWIGEPGLVVNMNVSWGKYATLWRLERLPEIYDLAEMKGALASRMDVWRENNLKDISYYFNEIYFNDKGENLPYFSFERFVLRHKHLDTFRKELPRIKTICQKAFERGCFGKLSPDEVFFKFDLQ